MLDGPLSPHISCPSYPSVELVLEVRSGSQGAYLSFHQKRLPKALPQASCTPEANVNNRSRGRFGLQMVAMHLGRTVPPGTTARWAIGI